MQVKPNSSANGVAENLKTTGAEETSRHLTLTTSKKAPPMKMQTVTAQIIAITLKTAPLLILRKTKKPLRKKKHTKPTRTSRNTILSKSQSLTKIVLRHTKLSRKVTSIWDLSSKTNLRTTTPL